MISIVIGTRPEAVKMAPIVLECRRRGVPCQVIGTGQHRELLTDTLRTFNIVPDIDLGIMRRDQTPMDVLTAAVPALCAELAGDTVLAQGDTTTVLAAAMAAFHMRIPFGHVEAGLRTNDLTQPFPEEYNRRVVAVGAAWNFAPTQLAAANLRNEGISDSRIYVVGNTIVDALNYRLRNYVEPSARRVRSAFVTCHRRENRGKPMEDIFAAVNDIALADPDLVIGVAIHPSPAVQQAAARYLEAQNIVKMPPLPYDDCLRAIRDAEFILTDSGGIQEEAAALGTPTGVLRETTERPEGVMAGICTLLGSDRSAIVGWALAPKPRVCATSVYGAGDSAARILDVLVRT